MDVARFSDVSKSRHALTGSNAPATGLGKRLQVAAESRGTTTAIVDETTHISFVDLLDEAHRFANGLATRGIGVGDVVVAQMPNWWETIVVAYGTWLRGAVLCPVVSIYREHELEFILRQAKPKIVVVPKDFRNYAHASLLVALRRTLDLDFGIVVVRGEFEGATSISEFGSIPLGIRDIDDAQSVGPDDVALLLYTSGTTAAPKGVIHSATTLLYESRSIAKVARLSPSDVVFMPSPLTHITGVLYGMVLPVDLGCTVVLLPRWDPQVAAQIIEKERATFTVSATPFLAGLTDWYETAGMRSSLQTFICGGADVPAELIMRARRVMGTVAVRTYGSSEMPTLCIGDPFGDEELSARTDGLPIEPARARLRKLENGMGELEVQGPELFLGYLDSELDEGAMTPDGWFRTGDLASIGVDGAITIRGRLKDIINRGGEKYSARDVEELLLQHPAIADVAIVGLPDLVLGEKACAIVVLRPGASLSLTETTTFLESKGLARQKFPERLELVANLDKTASGKVQKFVLKERLTKRLGDEVGRQQSDA